MSASAPFDQSWRETCEHELEPVTTTLVFSHPGDFHPLALRAIADLCIVLARHDSVGARICGLTMTDTTLTVTMRQ
jgi:hypothetical protein